MDESQIRNRNIREAVKSYLLEHRKLNFLIIIIFISIFLIYIAFLFFYSSLNDLSAVSQNTNSLGGVDNKTFIERLFPTFDEKIDELLFDENGLPIINTSSTSLSTLTNFSTEDNNELNVNSIEIEKEPILSYTIFEKPVSIKKFIKNKPKLCLEKISVVMKKDDTGKAVENFQNTLKSIEGFSTMVVSGVLDESTREQLYIFQKKYADIIYKSKKNTASSTEPTRLIDKETAHFLNLLCSFDKEDVNDYIKIPTLRYAKKESREVIDYDILSKEKESLNNKLATGTQEAVFSDDGNFVVFRSETIIDGRGVIKTELFNLTNSNKTNLEKNIKTLDFNKNNILLYGVENDLTMSLKTYNPIQNEVKGLTVLPMREWNVFWLGNNDNEIGIYNRPSAFAEGIYMVYNLATRKIDRKTTSRLGLSVIPTNSNNFSIASIGGLGNLQTILINNQTKTLGDLTLNTYAEKCSETLTLDGIFCAVPKSIQSNLVYPDDWYKGKYLSDDILIYKTISGTSTKIISTFENKPMSIIQLRVHNNGIFFLDEKTLSLYSIGF